jgi:hypothetical protein
VFQRDVGGRRLGVLDTDEVVISVCESCVLFFPLFGLISSSSSSSIRYPSQSLPARVDDACVLEE